MCACIYVRIYVRMYVRYYVGMYVGMHACLVVVVVVIVVRVVDALAAVVGGVVVCIDVVWSMCPLLASSCSFMFLGMSLCVCADYLHMFLF